MVELSDEESQLDILKNYFDSILLRDIVARHKLTSFRVLEEMATFLMANTSSLSSINKLKNLLGISFDKAKDYCGFLELARRGLEIYYYKTSTDREVDFLVKKGAVIEELIQVSYSLDEDKTKKREFAALKATVEELDRGVPRCMVLTMDRSEKVEWGGLDIEVVNVIDWLLGLD